MTVKSGLGLAAVALLTIVAARAASTKFVSTWKNPAATPIDKAGQKVAAFVITADESMRPGP